MARIRHDLERALSPITSDLLKEKSYLCFVDIFMRLGYLSQADYENEEHLFRHTTEWRGEYRVSFSYYGKDALRLFYLSFNNPG